MTDQREDKHDYMKGCGACGEEPCCPVAECGFKYRIDAAESSLSALRRQIEQIKGYARHKDECELSWAVGKRVASPEFERTLMKMVNGKIGHLWNHQCGLHGFGALGDTCRGCSWQPSERDPACTCGLSSLLASDQP